MDQLRDRERLAPKPGDELFVVREVLGEDLHRHGALEDAVGRLVDARHPARAQAVAELVATGDQRRAHRPSPPGAARAAAGAAVTAAARRHRLHHRRRRCRFLPRPCPRAGCRFPAGCVSVVAVVDVVVVSVVDVSCCRGRRVVGVPACRGRRSALSAPVGGHWSVDQRRRFVPASWSAALSSAPAVAGSSFTASMNRSAPELAASQSSDAAALRTVFSSALSCSALVAGIWPLMLARPAAGATAATAATSASRAEIPLRSPASRRV